MSTKMMQMMNPANPLQLRFEKYFVESGRPLIVPVEFIVLVDYDGETRTEYAAILDGQMLLFNADGHEITIQKYQPIWANNVLKNLDMRKKVEEAYWS